MCTGKCAKCTADLLFPLGLLAVVGNILLFFPNGEVWRTEEITENIWFFPGVIGGGLLAFLPASVMRAAGLEGSCCANRCGMMLSMLMSVLGVAGALYCMIVSVVGLQDGPLCDTGDGIFIYPFLNSTAEESYLFNQTSWTVCVQPHNVVMWNVVLFSILLSIGTLEAVLLLAQVINGLIGCLCGTCMNKNQIYFGDKSMFLGLLCTLYQAITIQVARNNITAPVQGSALFSVDITCVGTPAIRWTFISVNRHQSIAAWMLGGDANVTQMYEGRVETHPNGSLTISDLRLQDSGYYTITVTETSGNSKDMYMVLSVTGE
ncbi:transmembrane 4 L6 family member 1-like protein [Labeo rohita]|uniref:Transmembrane 4 L6 family member 1-like protein n=1 Tax=Labeo rohita TaxID=84645 RepID=A0A498LTE1_LABRO|nr:transmembrane 4 L6 family member 1-like protein [Labeo rohita]